MISKIGFALVAVIGSAKRPFQHVKQGVLKLDALSATCSRQVLSNSP